MTGLLYNFDFFKKSFKPKVDINIVHKKVDRLWALMQDKTVIIDKQKSLIVYTVI